MSTRLIIITGAIAVLTAGCSEKPAAAPDYDRAACHALAGITEQVATGVATVGKHRVDLAPAAKPVADLAIKAKDPAVAAAGKDLLKATQLPQSAGWQNDPIIDIASATTSMTTACSALYGDGPW